MKKEVLFAIIIGFIIGLIITYGIYRAQQAYKQSVEQAAIEATPQPTPEVNQLQQTSHTVTIQEPINQAVVLSDTITLRGTTTPNAYVTIVSETHEEIIQADDRGTFVTPFTLADGINILTVTALTSTQESAETQVTVIYQAEEPIEDEEPTEE